MMVMTQRHGQLLLEPFDENNPNQQWRIGINGEVYTEIQSQRRYISHRDECLDVDITSTPTGGWAFDTLGEHPHKYRIVPRVCPHRALRSTLGSIGIGLEPAAYMDDSNGWYIVTLGELTGKNIAHVRPVS
jgi:hypothetical protein